MSRRGENIYKRKDGRWEGRYIRDRYSDGSIHYGYIYARTYKEVKQKLLPLKQESMHSKLPADGRKVYFWLRAWLNEQEERLKSSTFSTYQYKIQRYVLPNIGQLTLSDLTSSTIQDLVDGWKNDSHLSPATIENIFRILHKAVSTAHKNGELAKDVCEGVVLPKRKRSKIRALSQEEQRRLERSAIRDPLGLPALLSLHTGLRIGEISALTWENIDLKKQVLYVQHTYQRISSSSKDKKTTLLLGDAKSTASQRMIPLSKRVVQLLKERKKTSQGAFLFMCNERPMEPRLINYHFKKIVEKAGLEKIHFHQLRHTFATRCMEVTGDIVSISTLLGHSSTRTTLDVYVDSQDKQRKKIISDMERVINF